MEQVSAESYCVQTKYYQILSFFSFSIILISTESFNNKRSENRESKTPLSLNVTALRVVISCRSLFYKNLNFLGFLYTISPT